jgi:Zn-dependent peptidase ImmA (M78 family)/DNA-binding XRE family transcriptional regulator
MIGERIKQARKAAGLPLRTLADRAGVTAMAISKYERGKSTPSSGVLLSLAKALEVPVEYFFRSAKVELREVEYRKHQKLPKKLQTKIEGDVLEQVERFFELMDLLPGGPISRFQIPDGIQSRIQGYDEIEDVAEVVRDKWNLGSNPISDLTDTLEERGIIVLQTAALHENAFDGLAATVNDVLVIVVGLGWPGDRQRFTLAHELGHLILKDRLAPEMDKERAANRFAGAFLVPRREVLKEVGESRTWLEPGELCALKKTYGLSMGGWLHRARNLKVLSEAGYKKMYQFFGAHGWVKNEPCDEYPREEPKLFQQLVFRALGEDLISESKGAELLRKPLKQFVAMRNLDRAASARHQ